MLQHKEEFGNKVEEFAQDDDFMTNFEQFGDNIRDRPKVGKSIGLVDYDFPAIDKAFLDSKFQRTNARELIENAKPKTVEPKIELTENKRGFFERIKSLITT